MSDESTDIEAADRSGMADESTAKPPLSEAASTVVEGVTEVLADIVDTDDDDPKDRTESTDPAATPQQLTAHPAAEFYPLMSGVPFAQLVADIKKNGLQQPIVLFKGQILDGRNRYRACLEAGIPLKTVEFHGDDKDAVAFIHSANLHRRHLTQAQKQDVVAKMLLAQAERSDREIGRMAHVDHKTVGAKRAALEICGEIPRRKTKTPPARRAIDLAIKRKASAVMAFSEGLHEGDINQQLNELLKILGDEKQRIVALPEFQRQSLARGFLAVLDIAVDQLRSIVSVPAFEGALLTSRASEIIPEI